MFFGRVGGWRECKFDFDSFLQQSLRGTHDSSLGLYRPVQPGPIFERELFSPAGELMKSTWNFGFRRSHVGLVQIEWFFDYSSSRR